MVKINRIKGKIVEKEKTVEELAVYLGIDKSTLYRRFSDNGESLSIKEANGIVEFLGLSPEEAISIFFAHDVA